jgi:hypothetical protein
VIEKSDRECGEEEEEEEKEHELLTYRKKGRHIGQQGRRKNEPS